VRTLWSLLAASALLVLGSALTLASQPQLSSQDVTFLSGDLMLHGRLFVPDGPGPFPAILWNHGSEKNPGYLPQLARPFVAAGYVFFAPFRRGQGTSPGPYIVEQLGAAPPPERNALTVSLLEDQVADQLAGLSYLQSAPSVDPARIAVIGGSFGGIQTLLGAEADPGYTAAIDCAGAAQTWAGNPILQARLMQAVGNITIPLLLIQAQNDYNIAPTQVLGGVVTQLGEPPRTQIYPPFGDGSVGQAGHNMCFIGADVWSADAIAFITQAAM
jgi:carboxymethylenebutenolidase